MILRRHIDIEKHEELSEYIYENPIDYHIGQLASSATKFRSMYYETEDSDKDTLKLSVIPNSSHIVVKDEEHPIDVLGIITNSSNNSSGVIDVETYKDISFLPDVIQIFCRGSFMERDANYEYVFENGDTEIAKPSPSPVRRMDEKITIIGIESLGGFAPRYWILNTESSGYMLLRERSGSIKLYDDVNAGSIVFTAFIGGEHPGTPLEDQEVINIISSMEYIDLISDYSETVPEEALEQYRSYQKPDLSDMEELL